MTERARWDRYISDGHVAVLYSPGWGAGWYTWEGGEYGTDLLFDTDLVDAVLNDKDQLAIVNKKYPNTYTGGLPLQVEWVPVGSRFEVREYDGNESVYVFGPDEGILA